MTTAHIKWYIVNKVHQLTNDEKIHILNTLKKKVTYTKNKNDYLFNLNKISEDDLQNVYEIIKLILENRETIHRMRQLRLEKEAEFKRLIEETLEKRKEKENSDYKENLMIKDFFDKNYKWSGDEAYVRYTTRPVDMNVRMKYRNIQDPDERIRKGNEETKKVYNRYKKLLINLKTSNTSIQWKSAMESDTEEEYDDDYSELESDVAESESKSSESESKSESSDSESDASSESSESSEDSESTESDSESELESGPLDKESESESISESVSVSSEKTKRYSDANSQDSKLEYLRQKLHEMGVKLESMTPYLVKQEYTFEF
jgi:hypothetical protein